MTSRHIRLKAPVLLIAMLVLALLVQACAAPVAPPAAEPPAVEPTAAPPEANVVPIPEAKGGIRKSDSGYEGVLNLWVLGYTPGNQFALPFDMAVAQFMADNPDIQVEITGYPPNDEGFTKLSTALQSGEGIDLLRLPSDRLPGFVAEGLIAPIDDYLTADDTSDIYPNLLNAVRLEDGSAYAWPLWVVPMGMYLNKTVFAEKGVELPSKNWTWDEFIETAKALTFTRENGEQVYGFSGFVDPGVVNTWALFMNQDPSVRPVTPEGTFGFATETAAAGMERYASMALEHKITPPDFGAQKDSDVKGGFTNGQYAMIVDATGPAAQFRRDGVDFEIYPIPTYNDNQLTVGAIGLIAVAEQDDDVKTQAAMDLARYLTSSAVQEDVPPSETTPTGFYLAPGARKSVQVAPPLDTFIPFVEYMWVTPIIPNWAPLTRLIHPQFQNVIFGQTDALSAMQEIEAEANSLIAGE